MKQSLYIVANATGFKCSCMGLLDANSATTGFGIGYQVLNPNKSVPNPM